MHPKLDTHPNPQHEQTCDPPYFEVAESFLHLILPNSQVSGGFRANQAPKPGTPATHSPRPPPNEGCWAERKRGEDPHSGVQRVLRDGSQRTGVDRQTGVDAGYGVWCGERPALSHCAALPGRVRTNNREGMLERRARAGQTLGYFRRPRHFQLAHPSEF